MSGEIIAWAIPVAMVMLVLAMVMTSIRLVIGPFAPDRVMALETLYSLSMLGMLMLSIYYDSSAYYEAALLIAVLGFASTTAMAKFLLRGEVIE